MLDKTTELIIKKNQKARKIMIKNKNVLIAVSVTAGAILALFGAVQLFKRKNYILCCKCQEPKSSDGEKEE